MAVRSPAWYRPSEPFALCGLAAPGQSSLHAAKLPRGYLDAPGKSGSDVVTLGPGFYRDRFGHDDGRQSR